MGTLLLHNGSDGFMEQKWIKMFILSITFHLVVFSSIFIIPESVPNMRMKDVIYEVDLVDSPMEEREQPKSGTRPVSAKNLSVPSKALNTKRIGRPTMKEKTLVVAKRTVNVKAKKIETPEAHSSKLLDEAINKIEKTVKAQENTPAPATTPARVETQPTAGAGTGRFGRSTVNEISMGIYESKVIDLLYSNWSYATSLLGPNSKAALFTIVLLTVQQDGTILSTTITRSSGNAQFDQSVLNAIKRSGTLPPFPESYRKAIEEIEINFNLSDLKDQ